MITTEVKNCARCGGNHSQLNFAPLTHPQEEWTHWAACPVNAEPIMLSKQTGWERFCDELRDSLLKYRELDTAMMNNLTVGRGTIRRWARGVSRPHEVLQKRIMEKYPIILQDFIDAERERNGSWR